MKKIGMQLVKDNGTRTYPKTGEVAVEHVYEICKLEEPAFKIVDYFELPADQQQEIQSQIEARQDLWGALPFILNCLKKEGLPQVSPTDGSFHDLLGPGRLFLMLDWNNEINGDRPLGQISAGKECAKNWSHAVGGHRKGGSRKASECGGWSESAMAESLVFCEAKNTPQKIPHLAAFVSLARNDEVDITLEGREAWTPWVGCVFTYPEYRGQRISEKLIALAEEYAVKEFNAEYTYISTDHIGLYEKYGYEFFTQCGTIWGESTRVLRKKL